MNKVAIKKSGLKKVTKKVVKKAKPELTVAQLEKKVMDLFDQVKANPKPFLETKQITLNNNLMAHNFNGPPPTYDLTEYTYLDACARSVLGENHKYIWEIKEMLGDVIFKITGTRI